MTGLGAISPNTIYGLTPVTFALSIFRSHEFLTITTTASSSVTGTYAQRRLYHVIFNPSATATVFVNWGAAAATTSQDILPQSAFSIGLIADDVRIFSTVGSVACKVLGLS